MKKKKNIYFLLMSTFIIWFIIAYKFWVISENNNLKLKENQPILIEEKTKKDNRLILNYQDPFLKQYINEEKKNLKIHTEKKEQKKEQKIIWPKIFYKGLINNSSKKVALFNFNGKDITLQEGQEFHNVKCLTILPKKAIFIYSKEKKEVLLK
ncbi:hypothetical protein N9H19_03375 [Flavobacteriales bacterium]|nr:hypothetical protein [Flavobacteriales bacterium]